MRVIGGEARGRRLAVPPGQGVRPTADRVREALFSSLGDLVEGARVLDCFAGSGALGIEALSRGAAAATFVERDARAAGTIERNLAALGLSDRAALVRLPVERFCAAPSGGPFDVVFADPPYAVGLAAVFDALRRLHEAGALAPGATVVVERSRRDPDLPEPPPRFLSALAARTYGDTVLLRYRHSHPSDEGSRPP